MNNRSDALFEILIILSLGLLLTGLGALIPSNCIGLESPMALDHIGRQTQRCEVKGIEHECLRYSARWERSDRCRCVLSEETTAIYHLQEREE